MQKANDRKGGGCRQREKRRKLESSAEEMQSSGLAQYLVLKTPLLDIPSLQYHYAFRKELVRPVGFWGLSTSGLYG